MRSCSKAIWSAASESSPSSTPGDSSGSTASGAGAGATGAGCGVPDTMERIVASDTVSAPC
eukprot:1871904-Pyramimonas_sp.AAC.1